MKAKVLVCLVLCALVVVASTTGCKRREQVYANIKGPAVTETVDPNAQNQ